MFRAVLTTVALMLLLGVPAAAHPTIDNAMEVVVHRDRVHVRAKVSLAQVDIANRIAVEDGLGSGPVDPAKLAVSIEAHKAYLLSHLRVSADGQPLAGTITAVAPPTTQVSWEGLEGENVAYDIDYPTGTPPAAVKVEQDLLKEFSRLGQPWVVMFVAQYRLSHEDEFTQGLLLPEEPLEISCTWPQVAPAAPTATTNTTAQAAPSISVTEPSRAKVRIGDTARQFTLHGLHHILTGYDHLLFVAALVIGATRLWDLVKVVTAFAVAHTLTLTLSVLGLVRLPSSVVEPIIAASIVVVALQNVFFPRQSRGAARLAVAFTFGLFHGLGFAGGLLEAMEGMPAINLAVALVAFTVGVELAHQLLIVPLYFILWPLRRKGESLQADAAASSYPILTHPPALRLASFLISLAGVIYLIAALRGA